MSRPLTGPPTGLPLSDQSRYCLRETGFHRPDPAGCPLKRRQTAPWQKAGRRLKQSHDPTLLSRLGFVGHAQPGTKMALNQAVLVVLNYVDIFTRRHEIPGT